MKIPTELTGRCIWCKRSFLFPRDKLSDWMTCPHCGKETACDPSGKPAAGGWMVWAALALKGAIAVVAVVAVVLIVTKALVGNRSPTESGQMSALRSYLQSRGELVQKYGKPVGGGPPSYSVTSERLTFTSEQLSVWAEFRGQECHFIRYTLPHAWTDEQLYAALVKNGSGWTEDSSAANLLLPTVAFRHFRSREGHQARYSPAFHRLELLSGQLVAAARQAQEQKRQKEAEVPTF